MTQGLRKAARGRALGTGKSDVPWFAIAVGFRFLRRPPEPLDAPVRVVHLGDLDFAIRYTTREHAEQVLNRLDWDSSNYCPRVVKVHRVSKWEVCPQEIEK
jgi:hypothetical protein